MLIVRRVSWPVISFISSFVPKFSKSQFFLLAKRKLNPIGKINTHRTIKKFFKKKALLSFFKKLSLLKVAVEQECVNRKIINPGTQGLGPRAWVGGVLTVGDFDSNVWQHTSTLVIVLLMISGNSANTPNSRAGRAN